MFIRRFIRGGYGKFFRARRGQRFLNGTWFLDFRFGVNFAKYNPQHFWRKVDGKEEIIGVKDGTGVSNEVGSDNQRKLYSQIVIEGNSVQQKPRNEDSNLIGNEGEVTCSESAKIADEEKGCKGFVGLENLHWLERSAIGKAKDELVEKTVVSELKNEGFEEVLIRKYSGTEWLNTFKDVGDFLRRNTRILPVHHVSGTPVHII
ncbi:hypothetical protein REPUB_Repub11eG0026800 [Reevesia pubescens]